MSAVVISGDSSGTVTLQAPAVAGSTTLTLPSVSGTVLTTATGQTLTAPIINGMGSSVITSGTAQASTSGTSIDFTGIPSWVKRITVMFNGVSTSGTSRVMVQLGDSGGVETTGYTGAINEGITFTTGFLLCGTAATDTRTGMMIITNLTANTFTEISNNFTATTSVFFGAGSKTLSATLDRVRITTANGTDTFDAGSINIMYE